MVDIYDEQLWIVIVGFLVAFVLALGIGANDVANTFGTSVGAKVLTMRQACILASICETLGSILLGAKVSDTVRKGVVDVNVFANETSLFMVGNVAALTGSCGWLFIATFFKMPVSGTHSIIGAIMGFSLVMKGLNGISWAKLGLIVASWFISPVLSGTVSISVFWLCRKFILSKGEDALEVGLRWLPIFYGFTFVINAFSIFYDGPDLLGFDQIPLWGIFILAFGIGIICAVLVKFLLVPWQRKTILAEIALSPMQNSLNYSSNSFGEGLPEVYSVQAPDSSRRHSYGGADNNDSLVQPDDNVKRRLSDATQPPAYNTVMEGGAHDNPGMAMGNGNLTGSGYLGKAPVIQMMPDSTAGGMSIEDPEPGHGSGIRQRLRTLSQGSVTSMLSAASSIRDRASDFRQSVQRSMSIASVHKEEHDDLRDTPEIARLFSFLQILTAVFGSFAHGGNDVSNAIGPVISIWLVAIYHDVTTEAITPIWILLIGGVGISLGLWIWGRRVIETMGEELTLITPSSGFCIELGSAFTVLVASNIGLPISSTHCKVGSIVFVGRFRSKENVDWKIFRNIVLAWVITIPASAALSALIMVIFKYAIPGLN